MTRTISAALAAVAVLLALCLPAAAEPRGLRPGPRPRRQGRPLPGAYLYITSPAAIGVANFITSKSGRYAVSGLVPGRYKVVAEMPGFKTLTVDGVSLSAGVTVTLDFRMQPTDIEEEPAAGRPGSPLDRDSARTAVVIDKDLITRLPLARDFTALLGLVPGLVFENETPGLRASVQGAPVTANVLVEDGVIVSHPIDARAFAPINVAIVDEVVVETAGHSVEAGPAQGAYVNVLYPPGAGATMGALSYGVSGKGLSDNLWKDAERTEMDGAEPLSLKREHDLSLTYGAPVLEDMAWLFANVRYRTRGYRAPFRYWTDPAGGRNFVYDYGRPRPLEPVQAPDERPRRVPGRPGVRLLQGRPARLGSRHRTSAPGVGHPGPRRRASLPHPLRRQLLGQPDHPGRPLARVRPLQAAPPPQRPGDRQARVLRRHQRPPLGRRRGQRPRSRQPHAGRRVHDPVRRRPAWGRSTSSSSAATTRRPSATSETWKADNLVYNYAAGSPYTYGTAVSPDLRGRGRLGPRRLLHRPGRRGLDDPQERAQADRGLRPGHVQDRPGGSRSRAACASTGPTPVSRPSPRARAATPSASRSAAASSTPLMGYNLYSTVNLAAWEKAIVWNTLRPGPGWPSISSATGGPSSRAPGPASPNTWGSATPRTFRPSTPGPPTTSSGTTRTATAWPTPPTAIPSSPTTSASTRPSSSARPSIPTWRLPWSRNGRPDWNRRSSAASPSRPATSSGARPTTSGTSSTTPRPGRAGGGSTRPPTAGGSPSRPSCRGRTATPTCR
ncbi:MAG: carboxypeptidase regulatory-like domain-containing protein [Chromatiales bacterium]|nr:carboxypeptidase regulatory-like domain-containing protein [Chromatiales bacterium]